MGDGGLKIKKRIKAGIGKAFPALLHRNFRYFWAGQCISLIGSWMQTAGQAWLVLQITNNAFLLGLLNAVQTLPVLIFSMFAGAIVDRFPKRKVTIITQTCLMACAFILSLLIWLNQAKYAYILIIAGIIGFVQSIDMPARQSMMVELVGREDLLNAIALNSSIFNAARVLGPVAAGLVMGWLGPGAAFFINGVSFIAVIFGLFKIRSEDKPNIELSQKSILKNTLEGLKYIFTKRILYTTFVLVAVIWMFSLNFNTLIPAFARDVLSQQEIGYGVLMSLMGIGATIGAVSLAARSGKGPKFSVLLTGGAVLSVFLTLVGVQKNFALSGLFLALAGWGMITFNASANSIIQLNSPDNMRGRIMGFYALVSGGVAPFGSLYAGYVAGNFGADFGFIISGAIGIIAVGTTAIFFIKNKSRDK